MGAYSDESGFVSARRARSMSCSRACVELFIDGEHV